MAKSLLGLSHCFMLLACRFIPENSHILCLAARYTRTALTTRSRVNRCSSFSPHSFAVLPLTRLEQTAFYSLILELQISMQTVRLPCTGSDHKSMAYSELSGLELLESYPWRWRRMVWDIQIWWLETITLVLQGMHEA